jgi:cysteine-rich repeat protein
MLRRLNLLMCVGALSSLMIVACDDELPPDEDAAVDSSVPDSATPEPDASVPDPVCGDGNVDPGEECDGGDNCADDCTLPPFCGDGNVDPGEECDDGNSTDGDGCSAACAEEATAALCEAAPADACEECGCTECASEMAACNNLAGVAAEGPGAGIAKSTLCQEVVLCGREAACRGTACFCGDIDLVTCLLEGPQGPCVGPISAAAETTSPVDVSARQSTPGYAVAAANAVSTCTVNSCTAECQ